MLTTEMVYTMRIVIMIFFVMTVAILVINNLRRDD